MAAVVHSCVVSSVLCSLVDGMIVVVLLRYDQLLFEAILELMIACLWLKSLP